MLVRIANHIREIESNKRSNKYIVLRQARINRFNIAFDVLYYSPCLLDEDIEKDIGEKEGELIREIMPCLNYQIPKEGDYKHYTINKLAREIRLRDIVSNGR